MTDHSFTINVGDNETSAKCLYEGPLSQHCDAPKLSKRHAGRLTTYLPEPSVDEDGPDDDEPDGRLYCNSGPCGFYTTSPEKLAAHKNAHSIFIQQAEPSPFTTQVFDGSAAKAFLREAERVLALVREKDRAYGGAWQQQGYMGNLARIQSKASRLKNMLWIDYSPENEGQVEPNEESVADTLRDLMALCTFALSNIEEGNRWGH